ncbi:MAG: sugar ABC transporter permease [Spirochaetaceae bacterium]|nr:sugar ABC transporter permease [Spirochaetaceae bacterium]
MLKKAKPYLFLLPAFFFLFVFTFYPIGVAVRTSFFKINLSNPSGSFNGIKNYLDLIGDRTFGVVLRNSLFYALSTIAIGFVLSLLLAVLLDTKIRFKSVYKVSLFYPTMIPMAAGALIWLWIYMPMYGLLDHYLGLLGLGSHNWLNDSRLALGSLVAVGIWKRLGYYVLFFLAGLQNIPASLTEAAVIDGARPFQRFFRITLPMLSSYAFFVFVTSIIDSIQAVDQVYIMTQGGPFESTNMIVYYIYETAFKYWDRGKGAAMTTLLTVFLLLVTIVVFRTIGKNVYYESE